MNDLIRTVEQTEECMWSFIHLSDSCTDVCGAVSQTDPAKTVQIFIDLIQRHEQSFYSFVHKVHSKGEGLFTGLMRWIELFLTLMRDGAGDRISLEFLLPHTGPEREDIIREVDAVRSRAPPDFAMRFDELQRDVSRDVVGPLVALSD